jgi:hypothetical protein
MGFLESRDGRGALRAVLRLLAAAGLALDAYVHADLSGRFQTGGTISESTLFRVQAGLAALAALLVFVRGRRPEAAFTLLIAAAALGAVLLYRYVDVGSIGPLPDMYDPAWYPEKTLGAVAEAVAVIAGAGLIVIRPTPRNGRRAPIRARAGSEQGA